MRRKRYEHKPASSTFGLNITSMTDMFTVLLVFLLQNYAASVVEIKNIDGLQLPVSNTDRNPTQAVQLSISKKGVFLDGKEIAQIVNGDFVVTDIDKNDSNFVNPIFTALEDLNKKNSQSDTRSVAQQNEIKEQEGKILIQADASFSYATLRKVMYTASMAGFPQVKLATVLGN